MEHPPNLSDCDPDLHPVNYPPSFTGVAFMKTSTVRRLIAVAFPLCLAILLAGCGSKVEGKYSDKEGVETIELKSGKATFTAAGNTQTCDYTVDGDKITLTGTPIVFTINKDGTLQAGNDTFTKTGG